MSKQDEPGRELPEALLSSLLSPAVPVLRLYNSLTKRKEEFIPINGKQVKWYSCGPTVYDASHMGHARTYISFDIVRRILSDYFSFDVIYVMNITDIDDKIIRRARQNYLFENFKEKSHSVDELLNVVTTLDAYMVDKINDTRDDDDTDKRNMLKKIHDRIDPVRRVLQEKFERGENLDADYIVRLLEEIRDPLAEYFDSKYGHQIDDNSIFTDLPRHWENEFHNDMDALNIVRPNVLTRVSEYVPEIIEYIRKIIDNRVAYVSNGSVYFDVAAFDAKPNHVYAKLVPEAYGDTKTLQQGEGDLSGDGREKKSCNDFALWKASKAGEPWWDSPWGKGRPGWHIECSVMASAILGDRLDIHTGGVDLKFPHHDNELAQAEAYHDNDCWIRYFLHTGHLTIAGCKMSKSLKNFITIKDALNKYTSRQLRFAFLLHKWNDTLDYSDNTMEMAIAYEKLFNEFFLNAKNLIQTKNVFFAKWTNLEFALQKDFSKMKENVHEALCDNIDTRSSLDAMKRFIASFNVYVRNSGGVNCSNLALVHDVASYMTKLMQIFGIIRSGDIIGFPVVVEGGHTSDLNIENILMPHLTALSEFRHVIRQEARQLKSSKILKECDRLRDDVLPNLGVRLEDQEGRCATVKLVDRIALIKEKEEKERLERRKTEENERKAVLQAEKDALRRIPPSEIFKKDTDKYCKFDDQGLPTHDIAGNELSKGLIKKLKKLQMQHAKKYDDYLQSMR